MFRSDPKTSLNNPYRDWPNFKGRVFSDKKKYKLEKGVAPLLIFKTSLYPFSVWWIKAAWQLFCLDQNNWQAPLGWDHIDKSQQFCIVLSDTWQMTRKRLLSHRAAPSKSISLDLDFALLFWIQLVATHKRLLRMHFLSIFHNWKL